MSASQAWALPYCEGDYSATAWDNCFGKVTWANGDQYIGDFKNGTSAPLNSIAALHTDLQALSSPVQGVRKLVTKHCEEPRVVTAGKVTKII